MDLGSTMADETIVNDVASEAFDRTVAEITRKEDFDDGTEHDPRGDWRCNQQRNSVSIVHGLMGFLWIQSGWIGHDSSHYQIMPTSGL
ncbi:hypothetical protein F0562_018513 [Nyssa sinensis]|uniref:Uncharacterized protein n=1 Tax=Nyssa sinensis TaxID=561372 RepID=A0A5J4ZDB4_9ASTE|nr:hypothetical protein F0562_018513 [Nyssa sinensis]